MSLKVLYFSSSLVIVVYYHFKTCCTLKEQTFAVRSRQYIDAEERMDKLLVTGIVSDHIVLEKYSEASCQSHISGVYCFLRHQTGAPLSVTKACGNLKQLHISHFTPFYAALPHNSPGRPKGGAEQVHCTLKARTKGRPITERGDLGPEDDGTWSMSP